MDIKKQEDILLRVSMDFNEFLEKEANFEGITKDEVQEIIKHFIG